MNGSEILINPYVGPRPIETGERLFGRARELTELQYLLSAERIVLLHSPSGAGKSSLIQAGLIPQLRERGENSVVRDDMRFVRDGKVVTSAGVSAGIDMALWLVGQIWSPDLARATQKGMEYDPAPPYQAMV